MEKLLIKLIEKLKDKPNGFTYNEILKLIELDDSEKETVKNLILKTATNAKRYVDNVADKDTIFELHNIYFPSANDEYFFSDKVKYYLKTENVFHYLDYQELIEARKTSKTANRNSLIAIGIAIITLSASIYFSYQSLYQQINIDDKQYEGLIRQSNILEAIKSDMTNNSNELNTAMEKINNNLTKLLK